jgi:hypothetical protein
LLERLKSEGKIDGFCDDYQNNPKTKYKEPERSPQYNRLVNGLKNSETYAVSEIRYCDKRELDIFVKAMKQAVPGVKFEYVYFENDPKTCEHNVIIRSRGAPPHGLNLIHYYTDLYKIPKGIAALPIYKL